MKKKFIIFMLTVLPLLVPLSNAGAYTVQMNVSAYCESGNVMANGEYPYYGAVASDDLPLGTHVIINGQEFVVCDRFGGGYTNRLDIYMQDYNDCIQFGRQWLYVEVL